jgi:acyl-CoA synthetase (NDP forming)
MKSFTAADLEALAHGQRVGSEVFRAVFANPEAVSDLARLLQVRELLEAPDPGAGEPVNLPDMDVTFDELARHAERRLDDPKREAVVERFLMRHFPEAVTESASNDTHIEFRGSQDTAFGTRAEEPRRKEPPAGR